MPGGSPKTTTTTQSKTDPYGPTIGPLNDVIGQLRGQIGNTAPTGNETSALDAMTRNAQAGNPYAGGIAGLAGDLLKGGTDRTGMVSGAYGDFKSAMSPYTTMDTNPYSNPSFVNATNVMSNNIMDRIKGQYAGAGYTPTSSGDFGQQVARGISQGVAPAWLQANNDMENRKLGAISGTYGGANTTAGLLSGLDQTALGNRQAGVGASSAALQAQDSPYVRMMQIEAQRRGLPLSGIGGLENLLLPIAQMGGTQNGTNVQEQHVPLAQQIMGGAMGGVGMLGASGALGSAGWLAPMMLGL